MSFRESLQYVPEDQVLHDAQGASGNSQENSAAISSEEVHGIIWDIWRDLSVVNPHTHSRVLRDINRSSSGRYEWDIKFGSMTLNELWMNHDFQQIARDILRNAVYVSTPDMYTRGDYKLTFTPDGVIVDVDPSVSEVQIDAPEQMALLFGSKTNKWLRFSSESKVTVSIGLTPKQRALTRRSNVKLIGSRYNSNAEKLFVADQQLAEGSGITAYHPVHIGRLGPKISTSVNLPEAGTNPNEPDVILEESGKQVTIESACRIYIAFVPPDTTSISVLHKDQDASPPEQNMREKQLVHIGIVYGSSDQDVNLFDPDDRAQFVVDTAVIPANSSLTKLLHQSCVTFGTVELTGLDGAHDDNAETTRSSLQDRAIATIWNQQHTSEKLSREILRLTQHVVTIDTVRSSEGTGLLRNVCFVQITDPDGSSHITDRGFAALRFLRVDSTSPTGVQGDANEEAEANNHRAKTDEPEWRYTGYVRSETGAYNLVMLSEEAVRAINDAMQAATGSEAGRLHTVARLISDTDYNRGIFE